MAYSSVTKPGDHFNTVLWTGNGSDDRNITGVGYQPDWVWIKCRSQAYHNYVFDSLRGATKRIVTNSGDAETTKSNELQSFLTDGFQVGSDNGMNQNTDTYVAWNWLAGGTAPAITYVVKVVSDSGNKYRFDDFGTSAVTLDLQEGGTYTFDQSDSSNSGHPLRFYTASDKTGGEYTTGVTTTGTPGSSGAQTVITVAASAPTLYYQCSNHAGMGGQANTNSTFGSSNFAGSIQSTVSAGTTQGFSIVSWTSDGSNSNGVGHGLGATPDVTIYKKRNNTGGWYAWFNETIDGSQDYIRLDTTDAKSDISTGTSGTPSSTTISNFGFTDTHTIIAYCFKSKKGYSRVGVYTGNGNADGTFIYTGFKPAWVLLRNSTSGSHSWLLFDNQRDPINAANQLLMPNQNSAESETSNEFDFLSNGFKLRSTGTDGNESGSTIIYLAFAENPFVANDSGTAVPVVAR